MTHSLPLPALCGKEYVLIEAGYFEMGSKSGSYAEQPVHSVYLDEFYIDRYLVSNLEFIEFTKATGYVTTAELDSRSVPPRKTWRAYATDERLDHPVVCVSWHDAVAYASWRGKRLPTEAEWEKAARGGLSNCLFPRGDQTPQLADSATSTLPTSPVGTDAPNAYGLHFMVGNVWQWCTDWYCENYYAESAKQNPSGPVSGDYRARRGGAWNVREAFRLRCANRGAMSPECAWTNLGFRCAWSPRHFQSEVRHALAELLPAMEPDGGGAEIVSIEGVTVTIRLIGSCVFCPSRALSSAALEKGLKARVPLIERVEILAASGSRDLKEGQGDGRR